MKFQLLILKPRLVDLKVHQYSGFAFNHLSGFEGGSERVLYLYNRVLVGKFLTSIHYANIS